MLKLFLITFIGLITIFGCGSSSDVPATPGDGGQAGYAGQGSAAYTVLVSHTGSIHGAALDDEYIYWTNNEGVARAPKAGGPSDLIVQSGSWGGPIVVGSSMLYFADYNSKSVWSAPKTGGAPKLVTTPESWPVHRLYLDGSTLYFGYAGGIASAPTEGGAAKSIASWSASGYEHGVPHFATDIVFDQSNAYVLDGSFGIFAFSKSTGAIRVVVDNFAKPQNDPFMLWNPTHIVLNSENIYYSNNNDDEIRVVSKSGGLATRYTGKDGHTSLVKQLTADDSSVVWQYNCRFMKQQKSAVGGEATVILDEDGSCGALLLLDANYIYFNIGGAIARTAR